MKKMTRVFLIGSLLMFLVGTGFVVAGLVMGVTSGDLKDMLEQYVPINGIEWEEYSIGKDAKLILPADQGEERTLEFDAEDIRKIELDLINVDCSIYPSSTDKILVNTTVSQNVLTTKESNGKLKIDCNFLVWDDDGVKVDIYLPKELEVDKFELSMSGKINMECPIRAKAVRLEVGGADFTCDSTIIADDFELELGAGNCELAYVDAVSIGIENGAGKVVMGLAGKKDQYNVKMEIAAGEVTYDSKKHVSLAQDFVDRPKDATRRIDIECAAGKVEIMFEEVLDV